MNLRTDRPTLDNQRGVSVVELLVALFLMSIVGLMFFQLFAGTLKTTMVLESEADLTFLGQRAVNDVRAELMQSRMMFQDDARGQAYLAKLQMAGTPPRLANLKLPLANPTGLIEPEGASDGFAGNAILIARQLNPLVVNVDHDSDGSTPNVDFLLDQYQFQFFYLSPDPDRNFAGNGFYLDLIRTESKPYADYFQLSGYDAALRSRLNSALDAQGVEHAWDPGADPLNAFYSIVTDGSFVLRAAHRPEMDYRKESMLPEFAGGRVTGAMTYSVGVQGTDVTKGKAPLSVIAYPNALFPSGLEVMIAGPSGTRKVYMRLVLMSESHSQISGHANEVVIANADF